MIAWVRNVLRAIDSMVRVVKCKKSEIQTHILYHKIQQLEQDDGEIDVEAFMPSWFGSCYYVFSLGNMRF
jgi:hypothetical protein